MNSPGDVVPGSEWRNVGRNASRAGVAVVVSLENRRVCYTSGPGKQWVPLTRFLQNWRRNP